MAMMIRQTKKTLIEYPYPVTIFQTEDGKEFLTFREAMDYVTSIENPLSKNTAVYEQVWTIQEAINKAVAEKRVVRFLWKGSNKDIKASVDDLKGCRLMKPSKESIDVAVIPEGIEDFDFDEVDTGVTYDSK